MFEIKINDTAKHVPFTSTASYHTSSARDNTPIVIDSCTTFGFTPSVEDLLPGTQEDVDLSVQHLIGYSKIFLEVLLN